MGIRVHSINIVALLFSCILGLAANANLIQENAQENYDSSGRDIDDALNNYSRNPANANADYEKVSPLEYKRRIKHVKEYVDEQLAQASGECYKEVRVAEKCCSANGALSCALGREESENDSVEMILGFAQMMGMTFAQSTSGVVGACKAMKATNYASAAINGAMTASCGSKRRRCMKACQDQMDIIRAGINEQCSEENSKLNVFVGIDEDNDRKSVYEPKPNPRCNEFRSRAPLYENRYLTCKESLRNAEMQMGTQAALSVASAAVSQACEQKIAAVEPQSLDPLGDDICTNPSNQTNPHCIVRNPNLCQLQININNSACSGYRNDPSGPSNSNFGNTTLGADNAVGDTVDGIDEFNQGFDGSGGADVSANSARLASTPGGGGGSGAPGGGGGGGGAAGSSGSPGLGGSARGFNTDILKGARGGSGYTVTPSQFKSGGGGFAGYGRGVASEKGASDKKVNLKSYLPGKKKDPRRRIASYNAKGIAGKHKNIFKQVENRFNQLCLFDRLVCDKSSRRLRKK